jgi:hypothetical protein
VPPVFVVVRDEPDDERVEPLVLPEERVLELLSRRTVVVLPVASVVFTVVRVVPLLFTRVSIVVEGWRWVVLVPVEAVFLVAVVEVERAEVPPVEVVDLVDVDDEAAVVLVERELVGAVVVLSVFGVLLVEAGVLLVEVAELLLVERADVPPVEVALLPVVAVLVEALVLVDVVVLFCSSFAADLFTSVRN